jgi:probable HAF family extracellular repeat protein
VVGRSQVSATEDHAFLYSNGSMTDLGTLGGSSRGMAINSAGHVTGYSHITSAGGSHAFVSRGGAMIDLNTLIPSGSGWTLQYGLAINDNGQITGVGTVNGEARAFLLTPVTPQAQIQPPIDADGSSVFSAKRGVIPIKFTLALDGTPTCQLPPATIAITRLTGNTVGAVDESVHLAAADNGQDFRVSDCQYQYNLAASSLGPGHYRVEIAIDGIVIGRAEFSLN